jgi:hypothetical protein
VRRAGRSAAPIVAALLLSLAPCHDGKQTLRGVAERLLRNLP